MHALSQVLTLQGAVAHVDMPVESGPTLYLPHSQKYSHGYVAYQQPEFQEYFVAHHVQLPLAKGDAVFFNPALFHAAGTNHTSDMRRMANLLQISSAFGRAMETVDRARIVNAVYPALLVAKTPGSPAEVANVIAASAEGYAFPTNLDRDQPIDGMAPPTRRSSSPRRCAIPGGAAARLTAQAEPAQPLTPPVGVVASTMALGNTPNRRRQGSGGGWWGRRAADDEVRLEDDVGVLGAGALEPLDGGGDSRLGHRLRRLADGRQVDGPRAGPRGLSS